MLIVLIKNSLFEEKILASCLICLILIIYGTYSYNIKPYESYIVNILLWKSITIIVCCIMINISIFNLESSSIGKNIGTYLIIAANSYMYLLILYKMFIVYF